MPSSRFFTLFQSIQWKYHWKIIKLIYFILQCIWVDSSWDAITTGVGAIYGINTLSLQEITHIIKLDRMKELILPSNFHPCNLEVSPNSFHCNCTVQQGVTVTLGWKKEKKSYQEAVVPFGFYFSLVLLDSIQCWWNVKGNNGQVLCFKIVPNVHVAVDEIFFFLAFLTNTCLRGWEEVQWIGHEFTFFVDPNRYNVCCLKWDQWKNQSN